MDASTLRRRHRKTNKPRGRPPKDTSAKLIKETLRARKILDMRLSGMSLAAIGEQQPNPVTPQRIHEIITHALQGLASESIEQSRHIEQLRLDKLFLAAWPQAVAGDIAAMDRCLKIMARRASLCGLDIQPLPQFIDSEQMVDELRVVRVEIVGDPEVKRVQWLEQRVLELEASPSETDGTAPRAAKDLQ
jgi:hypothetical protein